MKEICGNKSSLSQMDARFARTIQKIQRVLTQELNKIAIIHLYSAGFRGDELLNFQIGMANPSMIAELQGLELWRTRLEVASMAQQGDQGATFDSYFVYKNIFNLEDDEIEGIEEGKRRDKLFQLELESIQSPGSMAQPEDMGADVSAGGAGGLPPGPEAPEGAPIEPQAPSPEPGLPPPPGEEGVTSGPSLDTAGRDPNLQRAAPNDMINPGHSNNHNPNKMPNLQVHTYNTKKTGMDHKRNYSELMRSIRAPFGEELDKENELEEVFGKQLRQLQKFAKELEGIESLNPKSGKKVISG